MQVSENKETGNTTLVLAPFELELVKVALWDEQLWLMSVVRRYPDHEERLKEKRRQVVGMSRQLGIAVAEEV